MTYATCPTCEHENPVDPSDKTKVCEGCHTRFLVLEVTVDE